MADEMQTPLNDGELEIMQPIDTSEPARVPAVGDGGEFQTFKKPSVYVPYVQYDSIERLAVYGSVDGVSSIYVNSHQYVLPIPKPLTAGDVWHSKVKSSYDKRIVLDGTESSHLYEGMFSLDYSSAWPTPVSLASGVCSHYQYRTYATGKIGITDNGRAIVYKPSGDYTADEAGLTNWKAYLSNQKAAGTPVVVYYQSTDYDGTNGLTVSIADYRDEIYANNFVDIFTDDGELWVDGGDFAEVAVSNIVLNGKTNDERAGEYGTPQVHTFP